MQHIKFHIHCVCVRVCTSLVPLDHQASVFENPFYVEPAPNVLDDLGNGSALKNFIFPGNKAGFTKDVLYIYIYIYTTSCLQYIVSIIYIYIYILNIPSTFIAAYYKSTRDCLVLL